MSHHSTTATFTIAAACLVAALGPWGLLLALPLVYGRILRAEKVERDDLRRAAHTGRSALATRQTA